MSGLADRILSREEYLSAFKSKNSQDFSDYREHILSELLQLYRNRLFPTQLEVLRENFEASLQEVVDATPDDVEILNRKFDDQISLTLEEQRELVLKAHFECAFQRLKDNVRIIVKSTKYTVVPAHI
jgi:DNA-binding GntR family transcriptional regulator